MNRTLVIEPLTRVEGHGKVTIRLDENGQVEDARMHVVEFRGFERFILGRPYWEVPVTVQRLCGICPVSHLLCASKAMDQVIGVDRIPPTAEKIRRLMHYAQTFQSHALHFFHLASPDLLFGFGAELAQRNVLAVAREYPELALQGINMRRYGQEIIAATAGKKIHGTGSIPGGVNKSLSLAERDHFLAEIEQQLEWARAAVAIARDYTTENLELVLSMGAFESNHLAQVDEDGTLDLYDGALRAIDGRGEPIFDAMPAQAYHDVIAEEVRPWSYMKFPFIRELGPEKGWYRVGPLARMNVCRRLGTPEADAARSEFLSLTDGGPNNMNLAYHWARMIELLYCAEKIRELLLDPDLLGGDLRVEGEFRGEGVGIIEAPRGTLFHHYRVDEHDQVTMANLIVSTTSNNEAMNRAVLGVAKTHLSGHEIDDGLLNHIEVAIRAYDPCLSCATHAMGRMPLHLEIHDHQGRRIASRRKD
jgi:NAD-reducing hydrogenase large subunit